MWNKESAFTYSFVITFLILFTWGYYLRHLDWGTPDWKKHQLVFENQVALENAIPKMIKMRKEYYSFREQLLDTEKPFHVTYQKISRFKASAMPFEALSQEQLLDRSRGYLVGVINSDEQNTLQALSKLNPFQLQFNPGIDTYYGGFYYYTCGAVLYLAKIFNRLTLVPDLQFYFTHPEETKKMYLLVRSLGGISVFLSAILLLLLTHRYFGLSFAFLSVSFFITIPLLVPYSHMAKAHIYGMFLFLVGFYFLWKTISKPLLRYYLLGGLALGLSAGTIITNLTIGIVIFLIEWARNEWGVRKTFQNRNFYLTIGIFFLVYLVTNYYIFLDLPSFQRYIMGMREYTKGYDEYGKINLQNWLPFLKDMFTNQMHWSVLPLLLIGSIRAFQTRDKLLLVSVITVLFLTFTNLLTTRHPGVNIRAFPFIAMLTVLGCKFLWEGRSKVFRFLSGSYIFLALAFSLIQSSFYVSLLGKPEYLLSAGQWINENIPKGESIGIIGGHFTQAGVPPFQFLNYKIIHFPAPSQNVPFRKNQLPSYVIAQHDHPLFQTYYKLVKEWRRPQGLWGISFPSKWVSSGKVDIFIYKRNS